MLLRRYRWRTSPHDYNGGARLVEKLRKWRARLIAYCHVCHCLFADQTYLFKVSKKWQLTSFRWDHNHAATFRYASSVAVGRSFPRLVFKSNFRTFCISMLVPVNEAEAKSVNEKGTQKTASSASKISQFPYVDPTLLCNFILIYQQLTKSIPCIYA